MRADDASKYEQLSAEGVSHLPAKLRIGGASWASGRQPDHRIRIRDAERTSTVETSAKEIDHSLLEVMVRGFAVNGEGEDHEQRSVARLCARRTCGVSRRSIGDHFPPTGTKTRAQLCDKTRHAVFAFDPKLVMEDARESRSVLNRPRAISGIDQSLHQRQGNPGAEWLECRAVASSPQRRP